MQRNVIRLEGRQAQHAVRLQPPPNENWRSVCVHRKQLQLIILTETERLIRIVSMVSETLFDSLEIQQGLTTN
jgi:hypothetical protein